MTKIKFRRVSRYTNCSYTSFSSQSQPPTLLSSGVYRQRSYDNLHNGKSPSMQSLTRFVHLPRSSCDHINDLTVGAAIAAMSSDASSSSSSPSPSPATGVAPVPIHFKYFAPQQQNNSSNCHSSCESSQSIGAFSRYPYHQNRALAVRPLPNQHHPPVGSTSGTMIQPLSGLSDNDIRTYLDLNSPTSIRPPTSLNIPPPANPDTPPEQPAPQLHNVYRYRRHHRSNTSSGGRNNEHRLSNRPNRYQPRRKSSALSLLKDLDFIDESEDDPMLKDCNQFRVTRQHHHYSSSGSVGQGQSHDRDDRSPLKKKQRYSNIYDYSFNLSLNSIHEDSTSDDSL